MKNSHHWFGKSAGAFERYMANQTTFDKAVPAKYRRQAKLAVKDEYSFDFLVLGDEHSERSLSGRENERTFPIDMGGYFTFVGKQYREAVTSNGNSVFVSTINTLYEKPSVRVCIQQGLNTAGL